MHQKNTKLSPARCLLACAATIGFVTVWAGCREAGAAPEPDEVAAESRIVLMGNGLGSRMMHFGHFETDLHLLYPHQELFIRNMSDEGNTPSFRPHSGRSYQLGFPGAEEFHHPYTGGNTANAQGHFKTEEEWLEKLKPDIIIAFFGFNESFLGRPGLDNFRAELEAFVKHTVSQTYNGHSTPELVLVSPTAFEDLTATMDVPDGQTENRNLAAYTSVMESVATANEVRFIDAFNPSLQWFASADEPLTTDGALLNEAGYRKLSELLIARIFGGSTNPSDPRREKVHDLVMDKNWLWTNDFKIPNGVHVFGRRFNPYGPDNYPFEVDKIREMTAIRDQAIWAAARGETIDIDALDAQTSELPEVETNYPRADSITFLYGDEALETIQVPEGYKIEQWATEQEFPDLANPAQLTFDNQGRLWVTAMASYPHWRPGDPRPNDKLLILEDTNGDGKADTQTVFADGLHLPMGFEITAEGVFVSQNTNLVLLRDTTGDGKADTREIIFSGFDDHDTHHAISAFASDPSGAIILAEGTFHRTNVETAYGPVRGTNGGFYRFNPKRRHLERHAQLPIPNPWGTAFDDWGQPFFLHTSGPQMQWMTPGSIRAQYGSASPNSRNLIEEDHRVRPTSGLEFLSSRHFPDEVQGDIILNNTIGFLGAKQHGMMEDGTVFTTRFRQDLMDSSDSNFRPVDMEIAPDGSLFVVDWHNPLIGHMQHNARDPNRDHTHGRIYRITYPSRPLLDPPPIHNAEIEQLLNNLKLHEKGARERSRRELRGRDAEQVLAILTNWVSNLDENHPNHEHHLLEALWVTWGLNQIDEPLLRRVLASEDHRARAAAARVLRYTGHQVADQVELLKQAAADSHGRVKLEAIVAASWLNRDDGLAVLEAATSGTPERQSSEYVRVSPDGGIIQIRPPEKTGEITAFTLTLPGEDRAINLAEMEIYHEGANVTSQAGLSQSSEYNDGQYPISNLVDGNRDNFSHTAFEEDPWIRANFDSPIPIEEIKIWNRRNFEDRLHGAEVVFTAGKEKRASVEIDMEARKLFADDSWISPAYQTVLARLKEQAAKEIETPEAAPRHLAADAEASGLYAKGQEIYSREGHCATCHQPDGRGLPAAGFPPLGGTRWVTQNDQRLIKLTLKGLHGPMEVKGRHYPGQVPMTGFGELLDDEEIAAVLTYVRNAFGNEAPPIFPEKVEQVREATRDHRGFYSPEELLERHPHE